MTGCVSRSPDCLLRVAFSRTRNTVSLSKICMTPLYTHNKRTLCLVKKQRVLFIFPTQFCFHMPKPTFFSKNLFINQLLSCHFLFVRIPRLFTLSLIPKTTLVQTFLLALLLLHYSFYKRDPYSQGTAHRAPLLHTLQMRLEARL